VIAPIAKDYYQDTKRLPFYTDVDYTYDNYPVTLPDELPLFPISGGMQAPGLHELHKTLSLFAYFDMEDTMEVYKKTELILLRQEDDFLFGVGDPDASFYLVLTGKIKLSINDPQYGITDSQKFAMSSEKNQSFQFSRSWMSSLEMKVGAEQRMQ